MKILYGIQLNGNGHIHTPAIEKIDNKKYYNTEDFCESCSFIVETMEGDIELHYE